MGKIKKIIQCLVINIAFAVLWNVDVYSFPYFIALIAGPFYMGHIIGKKGDQ